MVLTREEALIRLQMRSINQNVDYATYGASSNILLFNGSSLQNQIKANALGYEASKMELQQAKDNLTINIILGLLAGA